MDDPARMVAEGISTSGYTYRAVVLVKAPLLEVARGLFQRLWRYDQVVFDRSAGARATNET